MNKKMLMVIIGETYRHCRHTRGTEKSYKLQKLATQSHLDFIDSVSNRLGLEIDVCLYIYSMNQDWDNEFIESYRHKLKFNKVLHTTRLGENVIQSRCLSAIKDQNIEEQGYDSILFIRPDLFLKDYFKEVFTDLDDKITFAHVNEILSSNKHCGGNKSNTLGDLPIPIPKDADPNLPTVSHQIFYVPKKFFNLLFEKKLWHEHFSYYESIKHISKDEINFFVDTFHSSCTSITWNPLYYQVNREQCYLWPDNGWKFDHTKAAPVYTGVEMYTDLIDLTDDFRKSEL
tara:strand:+ start:41 stop:901 length:861 start_codon:yes stop_codon:yes gene_type:complete